MEILGIHKEISHERNPAKELLGIKTKLIIDSFYSFKNFLAKLLSLMGVANFKGAPVFSNCSTSATNTLSF